MGPKTQRPPTSMKRQPATAMSKKIPWSDPPEEDKPPSPSSPRRSAPDAHWDPSSDSLSEGSESGAVCPGGDRKWARYLRHLPTKDDFKTLVAEVKEACEKEITAIRQDLKQVSDRV